METIFVRSPYNYDMDAASLASAVQPMVNEFDISPTVQSEKDNADINVIVKRFLKTGVAPADMRLPLPSDFIGVTDFRTAMEAVRQAQESFMKVPAEIRAKFDNDPQKFSEFAIKEDNLEEKEQLGLLSADGLDKLTKLREAAQLKKAEEDERRIDEAVRRRETAASRTKEAGRGV